MESTSGSGCVRSTSNNNILTYRRDERGMIQWDCLAPDSLKQTTEDYDEPDGDTGRVLIRPESERSGQRKSGTSCDTAASNHTTIAGNLCQFDQPRLPTTGNGETNHPESAVRGAAESFPPSGATTGSYISVPGDPEVKKRVSANLVRKSDTTGSMHPQYSPLTPPATPKKSPRTLCLGEGQSQGQGHSNQVSHVSRDGSKFSFPDSVTSEVRWGCPPSILTVNSPCASTRLTGSSQQGRQENVRLVSPVPTGGYPPKSPVVLSFQFDGNVDEVVLKKIIRKFNDDVAKEVDEIKPIALQDPPKPKLKKKQVRWQEDNIHTDDIREVTANDIVHREQHEDQFNGPSDGAFSFAVETSKESNFQNKEAIIRRQGAIYPNNSAYLPSSMEEGTTENFPQSERCHTDAEDGSQACFEKSPFLTMPRKGEKTSNRDKTNLRETSSICFLKSPFMDNCFEFEDPSRENKNQGRVSASPVSPETSRLQPQSPSIRRGSPTTHQHENLRTSSASKSPFLQASQFPFPPQLPSSFSFQPTPQFLVPSVSPSARQPPSPFLFPPSSPSIRPNPSSPSGYQSSTPPSPFRIPPKSPSRVQHKPYSHPTSRVVQHKDAGHSNDVPWNYYSFREEPESRFPRTSLPPAHNPWHFPASPKGHHATSVPRESTLQNHYPRASDPRRQLFSQCTGSPSKTESDVDAALTNTILNYLVKKNIMTVEDAERLRQNARGGNHDLNNSSRQDPSKSSMNPFDCHNDQSKSRIPCSSTAATDDEQIRILRNRGHSLGEIEDNLFARALELSRSPSIQRSYSSPVASSPSTTPVSGERGRETGRKRRRGNIDIRVECDEVVERKRQLTDDLVELNQPSGSQSCCCAEVEEQILHMTREAYTNIRRHDDTPEAFERFENEVQQTNINITESLCILRTLKRLCGHGRTIEHIYPGSMVIRMNCPSQNALFELWTWYKSGELLELFQQNLVTDSILLNFNAEEIKLRVTISEADFINCKEELLGGLDYPDIGHSVERPKQQQQQQLSQYQAALESTNENLLRPGYLTPKKSRPDFAACAQSTDFRPNSEADFPRDAETSTYFVPPVLASMAWDGRGFSSANAISGHIIDIPRGLSGQHIGIPLSPIHPKTPPGHHTHRRPLPHIAVPAADLSPSRRAFQELNCNPQ